MEHTPTSELASNTVTVPEVAPPPVDSVPPPASANTPPPLDFSDLEALENETKAKATANAAAKPSAPRSAAPPVKAPTEAKPVKVVSEAAPKQEATDNGPVALHVIYFDSDSSVLSLRNRTLIKDNVDWLKKNPGYGVMVEGHTDSTASPEYNIALGQTRADLVAEYVIALGIDRSRVNTVSYGEERPIDPSNTASARAKNRRVQFLVYKGDQ
jgi:peptidoglycan-associated lipoprotein